MARSQQRDTGIVFPIGSGNIWTFVPSIRLNTDGAVMETWQRCQVGADAIPEADRQCLGSSTVRHLGTASIVHELRIRTSGNRSRPQQGGW